MVMARDLAGSEEQGTHLRSVFPYLTFAAYFILWSLSAKTEEEEQKRTELCRPFPFAR